MLEHQQVQLWHSGPVLQWTGIWRGYAWSVTQVLSHWDRVTHICVVKLTTIGSDNGLSPGRRQAIIRTNAGILLIGPLGTKFSEILIEIYTFSFKKTHLKISSGKWRPFCFSLNVLYVRSNLQAACRWRRCQSFEWAKKKCRGGA